MGTRTELKCTFCRRTITGDEYSRGVEEFKSRATEESREQTDEEKREEKNTEEIQILEVFYQTQNKMNQKKLLTQVADYEQELYEKDQYIHELENERRRLEISLRYRSLERTL